MAEKADRLALVKKVLIVGAVLGTFEVAYLLLNQTEAPPNIRTDIDQKIAKTAGLDDQKRELMRVQLAVTDYMTQHDGNPPKDLTELVPTYFDSVPIDPSTTKPFQYTVTDKRFMIGDNKAEAKKGQAAQGQNPGEPAQDTQEEKEFLIASLDANQNKEHIPYNPSGKKDPFKPFDFSPDLDRASDKGPLERYDLPQWRMTAVLDVGGEPSAVIEDPNGHGFTVKKGTKVGMHDGVVTDVQADRVVVVESEVDFTGEKHEKTAEIPMMGAPAGSHSGSNNRPPRNTQ